jgi:NitT/TauT family transport system ATP-binding protein
MVFQSYTLFPWLTVQGNVEFGLRLRGLPEHARRTIARRCLKALAQTLPSELAEGSAAPGL